MKKISITALTSLALAPLVANAEVTSMSLERFKQKDNEKYWEVSLKCNDEQQARYMKRVVGKGNQWCSTEENGPCDSSKFVLSRKICGVEEPQAEQVAEATTPAATQAASKQTAPAPANDAANSVAEPTAEAVAAAAATEARRTELLKEQVMIEEQRILIEQKRLQLKVREIELQKQKAGN